MNAPGKDDAVQPDFLTEARRWLSLAQGDLEVAGLLFAQGRYSYVRHHCQQAGEKALKTVLLLQTRRCPPRLHALDKMLEQVGGPEEFRPELIKLSEDYFLTRYPDVEPSDPARQYDQDEAQRGLETTERLLTWARNQVEGDHAR